MRNSELRKPVSVRGSLTSPHQTARRMARGGPFSSGLAQKCQSQGALDGPRPAIGGCCPLGWGEGERQL